MELWQLPAEGKPALTLGLWEPSSNCALEEPSTLDREGGSKLICAWT